MRTVLLLIHIAWPSLCWGQFQLASDRDLVIYRGMVPEVDDKELEQVLDDPRLMWYTRKEMPAMYQHDIRRDGVMGGHDVNYNIAPLAGDILPDGTRVSSDFDPFGNGNREWPWDHPAVLDNSDNRVKNVIGMRLPEGLPVVYYTKDYLARTRSGKSQSFVRRGMGWAFPVGTEFIELVSTMVGDVDCTFKIFRMTKQEDGWLRRVYRPFPTRESYESALGRQVPMESRVVSIRNRHPVEVFNETVEMLYLPKEDAGTVMDLLVNTPFKLCVSDEFIPTTRFDNQIVPRQYLGRFITNGTDQKKCLNCHKEVGTHVSLVELNRDWYGLFRGSDELFSWHPLEPISISQNSTHTRFMVRRTFTNNGIVEEYDARKHLPPTYRVEK